VVERKVEGWGSGGEAVEGGREGKWRVEDGGRQKEEWR
jgi:hypothetical protein